MYLVILLFIAQGAWAEKTDFYHSDAMEFKPPKQLRNDSYFGFSTAYDRSSHKMIISAPTENENGKVYECDMDTRSCSEIFQEFVRHLPNKYKHNYWFGATVRAGSNFIVACAPRLTKEYARVYNGEIFSMAATYGQCYKRRAGQTNFTTSIKTTANTTGVTAVELVMETLGWSMDIGRDGSLIVGGPGMYKKRGLAAIYRPSQTNFPSLDRISDIRASFNFGYGVAAGYFLDQTNICYAVGSTYGINGLGQVYFYFYGQKKLRGPYLLTKGTDEDIVGSMFGAVLCAADLRNIKSKKPADLLVGAPTYASHLAYDAGAVYVYFYESMGKSLKYKRKITSQKPGSFFGSAIVNIGDLNGDGHDDVAIAAPYEDGVGAVYLYSGAELVSDKSDKALTYLQRISHAGYRSFGLGLSVLQDHDGNGCNEIAISAPYDDRVFVYRCLAAVTIKEITTEFPKLQNRDHGKTVFNFTVCIHLQYPEKPVNIIADISTNVALNHIHARLSQPNNGNMFTFTNSLNDRQPKYCQIVDFILPLDGNYNIQIGYDISTRLLHNPMDINFDSARVVISDTSVLSQKGAIWAADCAGVKECNPILLMNISSGISEPFTIGSKDMETIRIDVLNSGEIAYDPCIQFKLENAELYRPPMDCAEVNTLAGVYECTYRKPLRTAKIWTIDDITLNLKGLTNRHKNFTIYVTLFNQCKNNNKTQTDKYSVPLKSHYEGIDIKGTTNMGDVINMNKQDLHDGKYIEHIYTITNNGMTNLENLVAEITVNKEVFMLYPENPVSIYEEIKHKTSDRTYCTIKKQSSSLLIAGCAIEKLPKTNFFNVKMSMRIAPESLEYDKLLKENVTQTSNLIVEIDSFSKQQGIITVIQTHETAVALWIILLAVLFGILLIIILIITLSKCGCLTRRKKEELKELKEKVRRESVRRSMRYQPHHNESGRPSLDANEDIGLGDERED